MAGHATCRRSGGNEPFLCMRRLTMEDEKANARFVYVKERKNVRRRKLGRNNTDKKLKEKWIKVQ